MVKRAPGALAALGLLLGALGLVAPTTAAAQAVVIELSTAAPPITHRAEPGPLIEVVSLETHRRHPMAAVEIRPRAQEPTTDAFVPPPVVTQEPIVEVETLLPAADPARVDARFVMTSKRRLNELRALAPQDVDAALEKLERSGELQVLSRPQLTAAAGERASVAGERRLDATGSGRLALQPYGAELTLMPTLGDGSVRVDVRTQVGGADRVESQDLREGRTLVMAAPLQADQAGESAPSATQLAVIVTAHARAVADPPKPLLTDHSPRGPPRRPMMARLAKRVLHLLEKPYNGALAVLSAIRLA